MLDGVELIQMELVANLWPIVDETSEMIHRFAARAYLLDAQDSVISATLKTLAKTDFVLARQFPIPHSCAIVSEHGKINGIVTVPDFNSYQSFIVEEALRFLESDLPPLQGVGMTPEGKPFQKPIKPTFPKEPYFVVTFLIEDAAGNLTPYT